MFRKLIFDKSDRLYKLLPVLDGEEENKIKLINKKLPLISHCPSSIGDDFIVHNANLNFIDIKESTIVDWFIKWFEKKYNISFREEVEVLFFSSYSDLLKSLFFTFLDSEDVLLLSDPINPIYRNIALLTDAKIVKVPLLQRYYYLPNLSYIMSNFLINSAMFFINYPHEPIGAVMDDFYIKELYNFAKKMNILVVNEASGNLFLFENNEPMTFLKEKKYMNYFLEIISFKVGNSKFSPSFIICNKEISNYINNFVRKTDFTFDFYSLNLANFYLNNFESIRENFMNTVKTNLEFAIEKLNQWSWFYYKPAGGNFLWIKVPAGYSADGIYVSFLRNLNIQVIPGTLYGEYGEGFFVINLGISKENFIETFRRIEDLWIPMKFKKHRKEDNDRKAKN